MCVCVCGVHACMHLCFLLSWVGFPAHPTRCTHSSRRPQLPSAVMCTPPPPPSPRCNCDMVDGMYGHLCEHTMEHVCTNQCNGRGDCYLGYCR